MNAKFITLLIGTRHRQEAQIFNVDYITKIVRDECGSKVYFSDGSSVLAPIDPCKIRNALLAGTDSIYENKDE